MLSKTCCACGSVPLVLRELLIDYGRQILRLLLANLKADGFPVKDR